MINLVGYDDFGKEIRFNLSQVKALDHRRRSMTILDDEYEVIDPETVRCLDCEEIDRLREQVKVLRAALGSYAECCDGCTCGDGWSHDIAIEALEQTKPKDGE